MTAHHAALKNTFQNEEIQRLREENEYLKKTREHHNHQVNVVI